jgi:hypothetical protein
MGELYQVLQRCDAWEIVSKIKEMIPEYKSQNSDFQRLDKKIKEEEQVEVGV